MRPCLSTLSNTAGTQRLNISAAKPTQKTINATVHSAVGGQHLHIDRWLNRQIFTQFNKNFSWVIESLFTLLYSGYWCFSCTIFDLRRQSSPLNFSYVVQICLPRCHTHIFPSCNSYNLQHH